MTFIHPTWFQGTMFFVAIILIPMVIGIIVTVIGIITDNEGAWIGGILLMIIGLIVCVPGSVIAWHYAYEVPSVTQETITVEDWQPTFGHYWGEIDSADDLMLKTTDGRLFGNQEQLLFGKFDTRDILDKLKPNGTYKITYYGWREGFNDGVPNILSVDEVVNENGTPLHHDISNYMNKRSIIYADDGDYDHGNW